MYGSSYFDLKAELSRKEDQVKIKSNNQVNERKSNKTFEKIQSHTAKKKKEKKRNSEIVKKEDGKEIDDESLILYEKSKMKLEAKSKIYEKMQKGEMEDFENIYGETKFLVDFDQKASEAYSSSNTDSPSLQSTLMADADEEYKELLHKKWEKEQQEILEGPVHYENVKFDEIRDLGTGYFSFSKNEEERKKQMEDLQKMRNETLNIQAKKENLKNKRQAALQERLNKVKQRKLGIEPSPMDHLNVQVIQSGHSKEVTGNETAKAEQSCSGLSLSHTTIDTNIADIVSQCRKDAAKERPWDKGKANQFVQQAFVPSQKSKFNSLEQVVQERRNERDVEFAPPNFY